MRVAIALHVPTPGLSGPTSAMLIVVADFALAEIRAAAATRAASHNLGIAGAVPSLVATRLAYGTISAANLEPIRSIGQNMDVVAV